MRSERFRRVAVALLAAAALLAPAAAPARCEDCGGAFTADLLPPMNGQAADFAPRRAGAEAGADVRIAVAADGLYRVTGAELAAAGWDLGAFHGRDLRLFCRTQEVAALVSTEGAFATNDFLQFYGVAHRGNYTATNVYWLAAGVGGGLRMDVLDASTNAGGSQVSSHCAVARHAPDALYRAFYRPDDASLDHWFAALLTPSETNVAVATDAREAAGEASIVLRLHGLTVDDALNPDHRTRVKVGGTVVTSVVYDGEAGLVATGLFAAALLADGTSVVALAQTQSSNGHPAGDRAYLGEFAVSYPRSLRARDGELTFCGAAGTNVYAVSGFPTNAGLGVFDVTDPARPAVLGDAAVAGSPPDCTVRFRTVSDAPRRYHVALESRIRAAASVKRVFFRGLASGARRADYLAICPYAFREPAYGILKHRELNGLAVAVAPLEDLYNEFGYGIEDAAAIKQFVGFAYHHWQGPPPRYLCLMGEGTYDPRDNLGLNPPNLLPVHLGPTPFSWAAQDNWYAMVDGADTLPDLAVGRMAAASAVTLGHVRDKILLHERTNRFRNATLVADNVDATYAPPLNFKAATRALIHTNLFLAGYSISQQYLDDTPSTSTVRSAIRSSINAGRHVVTFFGHGSESLWCAENVWNTADVAALTNAVQPIVAIFSCNSGVFHDPAVESLAEAFVEGPQRGAVACVAPSALSIQVYAEQIADGFFDVFTNGSARVGEALDEGLLRLWQYNPYASELYSYETFGDPALRIHNP